MFLDSVSNPDGIHSLKSDGCDGGQMDEISGGYAHPALWASYRL